VVKIAKNVKPSKRGELEITDINKTYLENGKLSVKLLGRGYSWLDAGTYESLLDASLFIKTLEERQGIMISCAQEIAYRNGYISKEELINLAQDFPDAYREYLLRLIK
jgi:glucose-1-phosphate thymidylyltransferase